jgi:hypothetical protein
LDMKKLYDAVNVTLSLQVIICYIAFCDSAALLLAEYLHVPSCWLEYFTNFLYFIWPK